MEEELKSNFVSLKNRVWKSYKSRINAAERLKGKNEFIAFLSIYYSAILAAVSILNYVNKSENMDVFSIVLSVMVTILFLYFEGRNYKERYLKMKENYNNINLLYYDIENSISLKQIDINKFNEFSEKYIKLLGSVENHSEYDYIKYALKDSEVKIEFKDILKYYFRVTISFVIKAIVTIIPTFVLGISLLQLLF